MARATLIALALLISVSAANATTIVKDNGDVVEVPEGYEVRLVKKGAVEHCVAIDFVYFQRIEEIVPDCVDQDGGPQFSPQPPPCPD